VRAVTRAADDRNHRGEKQVPKLTTEQKFQNTRNRMLDIAKQYSTGTYIRKFVAPLFQSMIRAEAAAHPCIFAQAIVDCELREVRREIGQCVCVTCGRVAVWKGNTNGGGEIETGHFLASRCNSILFEEMNVAPQCKVCNRHRGGEQQLYRKWMMNTRPGDVERLERLKPQSKSFTRDELVDMRIGYAARLQAAVSLMEGKSNAGFKS
jgi:hypothetical protein